MYTNSRSVEWAEVLTVNSWELWEQNCDWWMYVDVCEVLWWTCRWVWSWWVQPSDRHIIIICWCSSVSLDNQVDWQTLQYFTVLSPPWSSHCHWSAAYDIILSPHVDYCSCCYHIVSLLLFMMVSCHSQGLSSVDQNTLCLKKKGPPVNSL